MPDCWAYFQYTSGLCTKDTAVGRNTGWFKKMDSISYVYISWTIHGMWMIYITFERGGPKFLNTTARAHSRAAASVESKMATMQHKIFYVLEFIKTESATAVQRAFRLRFNIQPPARQSICRWNHQFLILKYRLTKSSPSFWITLYIHGNHLCTCICTFWACPFSSIEVMRMFRARSTCYHSNSDRGWRGNTVT